MRHLVIPDTQVKPSSNTDHLVWAAKFAVDKKPEKIIFLGDHWDMESLCSYDVGKKSFEGRSYQKDVKAGQKAMCRFMQVIHAEQERMRTNKQKIWKPELTFLMGNHEFRIEKAVEYDRKLEGLMDYADLGLQHFGFNVIPYLKVHVIDGVAYSHFFTSGVMGRPVSSARLMLTKKLMSCVMGHVQDRDIAYAKRADGTTMTGIFAGIFYQEDQPYLNPQTNESWKGVWMLHDVRDGSFDEMPVSMTYLKRKYG